MLCFRRIICLGPWQCRLKYLFEFAKGLGARESWLGDPSLAAGRDVQHPERHFQNPRCLELLQAAVRHRSAAFYESGMHPYCPPMPWMPRIANSTEIPNMGVVFAELYHSERNHQGKGNVLLFPTPLPRHAVAMSAAANDSAACFDTIAGPLE